MKRIAFLRCPPKQWVQRRLAMILQNYGHRPTMVVGRLKKPLKYAVKNDQYNRVYSTQEERIQEYEKLLEETDCDIIIYWGNWSTHTSFFSEYIKTRNVLNEKHNLGLKAIDILHMEYGHIWPLLLQCDPMGISLHSSLASKPLGDLSEQQEEELSLWLQKNERISYGGVLHYSREEIYDKLSIPPNKELIFCPMQIPQDATLRYHAHWCQSLEDYLDTCNRMFDSDRFHIVFKAHFLECPEQEQQLHETIERLQELEHVLYITSDHEIHTKCFLRHANAVVTVNSNAGCEAMSYGTPVITFGESSFTRLTIRWGKLNDVKKYDADIKRYKSLEHQKQIRSFLYELVFHHSLECDWQPDIVIRRLNSLLRYHQL